MIPSFVNADSPETGELRDGHGSDTALGFGT